MIALLHRLPIVLLGRGRPHRAGIRIAALGGPPTGDELHPAFLVAGGGAGVVYWAVRRQVGWS